MLIKRFISTKLFVFLCFCHLTAQVREVTSLNDHWKFHQGGIAFANRYDVKGYPENLDNRWQIVDLPHTWNKTDPFDDDPSYYRGIGWYRKTFERSFIDPKKRYYLRFEGAAFKTEVYVNGALASVHKGGYTGFTVDITPYLFEGKNLLAIMVDNSHDPVIAPLSIGYALYGGIYRDVWLIETNNIHFEIDYYGADGIFFTPNMYSKTLADFEIKGRIKSFVKSNLPLKVQLALKSSSGQLVWSQSQIFKEQDNHRAIDFFQKGSIQDPRLWSPENPTLYTLICEISVEGRVLDRLTQKVGFRWFELDPEKGFILNGNPYQLKGTNRHQDVQGYGDALDNAFHRKDLNWIKSMGANFLRLAHYPQDPLVYQLADELGLLLWSEIPNLNYINPSSQLTEQSALQIKEMIHQHYNHPAVVFWGSSNEIFLWGQTGKRQSKITDLEYGAKVKNFVYQMDSTIRANDPIRLTTLAIHGSSDYDIMGITDIPDMISVNLYDGWYGGQFDGFGRNLDKRKTEFPHQKIFVSEYGAGSDKRIHAIHPKRFDFSGEYQLLFHEAYLKQINERQYLIGSAIWNQFDFSQPHTGGSINHLNQKGVMGFDRLPKDVYYFYQANWIDSPMVYLGIRDWPIRTIWEGKVEHDDLSSIHSIPVFTNMDSVELMVNGISMGFRQPNEVGIARWQVNLSPGDFWITALTRDSQNKKILSDAFKLRVEGVDLNLKTSQSLAINTGFHGEFRDEADELWLPDSKWKNMHYGFVGGQSMMFNKDIVFYGTNDRDPLFNYVLEGMSSYQLQVDDGEYLVELFFAEGEVYKSGQRIFDVLVNGKMFLQNLDLYNNYGFAKAFSKSVVVEANEGLGIKIDFNKIIGEPIISALRITKIL